MVIGTKSTSADALLDASRKREAARKMFIVDVAVFRFILWQPKEVLSPLRAVVVEPRIQGKVEVQCVLGPIFSGGGAVLKEHASRCGEIGEMQRQKSGPCFSACTLHQTRIYVQ